MQAILTVHIAAGVISVLAGAAALSVRTGGRIHRAAGNVFAGAMSVMAIGAALLGDVGAGIVTLYLVATAWLAVRRRDGGAGGLGVAAFLLALGLSIGTLQGALETASGARVAENPYIVTAQLIFAAVLGLAAVADLSVVLRRGVSGAQRTARHLWRMCFALLVAVGSFAAQGVDALPPALNGPLFLLATLILVLAVMIYWLVRVLFVGRRLRSPATA